MRASHLEHGETGCEVFHLGGEDRENLFAFCFTTPPRDDTGATHILEHCALSGSKKFPLKEPFSVLMKGSMSTFLNAFTFPDRTVFPAASQNRADFFNLMMVYGDAVFFPLLRKETFMQEAWRLEFGEGGDPRYAGVVYNEMKGAYSSPESVVGEWAYRSLFPDTPYRFDSGGDPKAIPSLAREKLVEYHALHYHPSNCRIFLYGNIPLEEELEFIQRNFLAPFGRGQGCGPLPLQERWHGARRLEKAYPVRPDSQTDNRSTVCVSWLTASVTEPLDLLAMEILSDILIGSAGSPLRKSLVDSGLGEDLSPVSGLETELREAVFGVGLRGTRPELMERIEGLVMRNLSDLAAQGIDPALIESTINRVEFRNREIRGGGSPYSLRLMRRTLRGWIYGMDPAQSVVFTPVMGELKTALAKGNIRFESLIERDLISNPHRVTLLVKPDPSKQGKENEELTAHLASIVSRLGEEERRRLILETDAFTAYQKRAEGPKETALIPSLARADLSREVEIIPSVQETVNGTIPLFLHDIFTNGIAYIDFFFPIEGIKNGLSRLLPLFCRAVTGIGLPGISYAKVAIELHRLTGGFFSSIDASGIAGKPGETGRYLFFRVKSLWQNLRPALSLVRRLLIEADFRDKTRLRDIIREMRNDQKAALIPSGNHFAALLAGSRLSASVKTEEEWKGVTQLLFLEDLAVHLDERIDGVVSSLEEIRRILIGAGGLLFNATAPEDGFTEIKDALCEFADGFPKGAPARKARRVSKALRAPEGGAESLVTSASVGYVARAIRGFRFEDKRSAAQTVLGHLLSTGYLWEKVRMEGGAYGAFSYPRSMDGIFIFSSYRDPHIVRTLREFRASLEEVSRGTTDDKDVDSAVIGTIGREERPMDPGEKGFASLQRRLYGITDELRQTHRSLVLDVDSAVLQAAARDLLAEFDKGFSVVVSNRTAVAQAGAEMAELAAIVREIPE